MLRTFLSELGFHVVFSRPGHRVRATRCETRAVGKEETGELKRFLFSVKAGDLRAAEWTPAFRRCASSLNDMRRFTSPPVSRRTTES